VATCELNLQIYNSTSSTSFTLNKCDGINQFPLTLPPGVTTPVETATSPYQILGDVTYADQNGGLFNVHFYIPCLGNNNFSITSNPSGRYNGSFDGSTGGWHVTTKAVIGLGSGGVDEIAERLVKEANRRGVSVDRLVAELTSQAKEGISSATRS